MQSDKTSPENTLSSNKDSLFLVQTPEKKPLDKRAFIVVIIVSVVGVFIFFLVLIAALIGTANTAASQYTQQAYAHTTKLRAVLDDMSPTQVVNKRSTDSDVTSIAVSEASQPSLAPNMLGGTSQSYQNAIDTQEKVHVYYDHLNKYSKNINLLISFDSAYQALTVQAKAIDATLIPLEPTTIRAVGGSYAQLAKTIEQTDAPLQLVATKKQLVSLYKEKSALYLGWAVAVESANAAGAVQAQKELLDTDAKIIALMEDSNYVKLFTRSYDSLRAEYKAVTNKLAN